MNATLTFGAALLLGLAASGHCLAMCGGLSTAVAIATAKNSRGHPQLTLLIGYQLGRIASYSLAGLLFAGILGGLISWLDIEAVRRTLRVLAAIAVLLGAFVAFGLVRDPGKGIGRWIWPRLAPLGRRLLPVQNLPKAFAFGMLWGWMPCGLVYTVLLIATLQTSALRGAITMMAFGLGTVPALLLTSFGAQTLIRFAARPATRHMAGTVLLIGAMLTLAGPWLPHMATHLHDLTLDCVAAP